MLISCFHQYACFWHTGFVAKILNLVKIFLVSLKELLILFLDLHLIKKWISSFLWISYLCLFFCFNWIIACLWDMLKCPFSFASNTELQRSPSVYSKMFHKILLLSHSYLEICHFTRFSENRINLFLLNPRHSSVKWSHLGQILKILKKF